VDQAPGWFWDEVYQTVIRSWRESRWPGLENGKTAFVDFLENGQSRMGIDRVHRAEAPTSMPPPFSATIWHEPRNCAAFAIQNMTGSSGRQRVPGRMPETVLVAVPSEPVARPIRRGRPEIYGSGLVSMANIIPQPRGAGATRCCQRLISGELRVGDAAEHASAGYDGSCHRFDMKRCHRPIPEDHVMNAGPSPR